MEAITDDYLDMTVLIYLVRDQAQDQPARLKIAADVAAQLVLEGEILPGKITDDGFAPWPSSPEDSAQRIITEAALVVAEKKDIYPGIIAWFDTPESITERAAGNDRSRREEP